MPLQYHLRFQFVIVINARQYCEQSSFYASDYKGGMLVDILGRRERSLQAMILIISRNRDGDVNKD